MPDSGSAKPIEAPPAPVCPKDFSLGLRSSPSHNSRSCHEVRPRHAATRARGYGRRPDARKAVVRARVVRHRQPKAQPKAHPERDVISPIGAGAAALVRPAGRVRRAQRLDLPRRNQRRRGGPCHRPIGQSQPPPVLCAPSSTRPTTAAQVSNSVTSGASCPPPRPCVEIMVLLIIRAD
jgi:hypothetical protein